jgi:hypothetical protein
MTNNYSIMADHIVSKYVERISGDDIDETFVDDSPADRVMVGMLAENRVDESFGGGYIENNNTRFESVPSISITFLVKKDPAGVLRIIPKGLLFYAVDPDYEKTVDYLVQKYSEKDNVRYSGILQLCECYPEEKFYLPLTYKKVRIEDEMGEGIAINLNGIRDKRFHLENEITERLTFLADRISSEIRIAQCNRMTFFDLADESRFRIVTGCREEKTQPRWGIDICCNVSDEGENYRFLLQMVNKTPVNGKANTGYLPKIFNAGMAVVGNESVVFRNIKLDYFKNSFKERSLVYAVAENTSAYFDADNRTIFTDNIPKYYQLRMKTKDDFIQYVTFDKLIEDPISNLTYIYNVMKSDYQKCDDEFQTTKFQTSVAKEKFGDALEEYNREINRFRKGIEQIEYKDYVKKAFMYMNKTFQTKFGGGHRSMTGWRLFQIVFIVSMISEMIRSEYKDDRTIAEADLEVANLLYFPTGGGKTEAFLGACVFDMFFDRLRGKNEGITALLKYPLRLLAVQQLDRVLTVVMKANVVREAIDELRLSNPFQVGFFVGKNNTPNNISAFETLSDRGKKEKPTDLIIESDQDTLNDYYRFIDTCPYCGEKQVNLRFNKDSWKLEHVCDNSDCPLGVLPLLIVDNEIYRYLPSIVVSIVDKMAMLGTSNDFRSLFGQVRGKCSIHGFSSGLKCSCTACTNKKSLTSVGQLKDPIPTLFIQDEMHLVKESLGTFDSHYESFINYYSKELVPLQQRKQIRLVGATATISMYKEHIRNLYHMSGRRFPCEYPSVKSGEDFYSYTDTNDITRILLGYAPYGRSITDGMWESVYIMRLVVYRMIQFLDKSYTEICGRGFVGSIDEYKEMLYDYWIELVYNNRKQDAMELENAFQNQGNNYLESKGIPKFEIEQMTSDVDFQTVRKTLFDIQVNRHDFESTNLLLATSTISHGVDEDSFNVMYFFGMPNNNAEYIQAYSRTGRKYTGIVIDIIRLMRIRDRSYLKNFVLFHQNRDDLVESVPINRWAKNAVYSTLPGLLAGLIMQYYTVKTETDNLYQATKVKKLLMEGEIIITDVSEKLIEAYGCNEQEKMSLAYKEIITEETISILSGIQNGNFTTNDFLSDAIAKFSKGKKSPMRSLRDTEEQIVIEI